MVSSRLTRRTNKQSKRQLYYYIATIFIVLVVVFNFGPYLIGGLGRVIDALSGKGNQATKIVESTDLQPPRLDPIPVATPSARIDISGRTDYAIGTVDLYVNNSRQDSQKVTSSQTFEFEDVPLRSGSNSIKAKITIGDKESDFSEEEQIIYSKSAPKLEISFPQDKQSFSKADQQISIKGATDPDNTVDVNGFIAIVDSTGNFSYDYKLNNGENKLIINAVGRSGQTTTHEITVSYSE